MNDRTTRPLGRTAAAVTVAGTMAAGRVFGANDRIQVAVVGLNGQGETHINECHGQDGVEVVALCDVDRRVLHNRAASLQRRSGVAPKTYTDVRELLENDAVDVVTVATPNHWHSLAAILACQAGKDVYVEKPLSHSVWEGRQLVAAAAQTGRIVQHGTQNRSNTGWMRDIQLLHDGVIGEIHMARGLCYKTRRRESIGFAKPERPPRRLDWGLWQGPAQERPYCDNYVHYNWHWFWEYGNGEIGNQGVHQMDVAVWGLGRGMPVKAYSTGGRYAWDDQGETPNTQVAKFTYADGAMLVFEVRNLGSFDEAGITVGNMFFGSQGYYVGGGGFFDYAGKKLDVKADTPSSQGRFGNFFKAVRSRKQEDVPANVLDGHVSCTHCHLANISYRLGRSLEFDPDTERFIGDPEADAFLRRDYRDGFAVPELA